MVEPSVSNIEPEKLKAAVVGAGKMGLLHASILDTLPDVEVVAFCDKSNLIRKFCRKLLPSVTVVDDVSELLDSDIDIFYVTTPIPSHYSVISSLSSRKELPHLFVEKTLSSSYEKSIKLCELAKERKKLNMVGYMKRFAVTFLKAKELLDQNSIGQIRSFTAYAFSSDFFGAEKSLQTSLRGGVVNDLGSHAIDAALWYFNEFEIKPGTINLGNDPSSDGVVHFGVRTSEGVEGSFDMSWSKEGYHVPEIGLSIEGESGKIRVNDDIVELKSDSGRPSTWHRHDLADNVGFLLGGPEYYREDACFVDSIRKNSEVESDFVSASKVDYIIEKVLQRAENSAE